MNKINMEEYGVFAMHWSSGAFPHQRFGQAFMNHFYTGKDLIDSNLWYCEDENKAVDIIWFKYINIGA